MIPRSYSRHPALQLNFIRKDDTTPFGVPIRVRRLDETRSNMHSEAECNAVPQSICDERIGRYDSDWNSFIPTLDKTPALMAAVVTAAVRFVEQRALIP